MNIHQFIDHRNKSLWDQINSTVPVILETHSASHFYHRFFEKNIVIYAPDRDGTIELFTHELLHTDLITRGITITDVLKECFRMEPLLHWTLSENLFEQVGQFLEHDMMFPVYLEMGYQRELFSENYFMHCFSPMSVQLIRSGMMKKVPSPASLDMFIHKFIAMKANLNPMFDYSDQLDFLNSVSSLLYQLLDDFWEKWTALDANKKNFYSLAETFIHQLGLWVIENRYVKERVRA